MGQAATRLELSDSPSDPRIYAWYASVATARCAQLRAAAQHCTGRRGRRPRMELLGADHSRLQARARPGLPGLQSFFAPAARHDQDGVATWDALPLVRTRAFAARFGATKHPWCRARGRPAAAARSLAPAPRLQERAAVSRPGEAAEARNGGPQLAAMANNSLATGGFQPPHEQNTPPHEQKGKHVAAYSLRTGVCMAHMRLDALELDDVHSETLNSSSEVKTVPLDRTCFAVFKQKS